MAAYGAAPFAAIQSPHLQTPSWLHSLLPPGGKLSLSIQHPTTGIPGAGAAPLGARGDQPVDPSRGAGSQGVGGATAPGVGSGPGVTGTPGAGAPVAPHDQNPNDGNWWNPYSGKQEAIPGVNAAGVITDPNAFWAYYSSNKSAVLDVLAARLAGGPATNFQKPVDYNSIIQGDSRYQTGLADQNQGRWNAALGYGDASIYGNMMTPDQQAAAANNPNSIINQMKRALLKSNYDANSTTAAHGGWSSGARQQNLENNALDNVREQAHQRDLAIADKQGFDKAQSSLFDTVKNQLQTEGAFDPGDQEHNQALYDATHAAITQTVNSANALAHQHPTSSQDAQHLIDAINKALKDHSTLLGGKTITDLKNRIIYLKAVIAHSGGKGQIMTRTVGAPSVLNTLGGAQAGGPGGFHRP